MLISMLTCVGSSSDDRADARSASSAAVKSSSALADAPPRADLMALEMATSGIASSGSSESSSISICSISPRGSGRREGSVRSGVPSPCRSRACSRNLAKSLTGSAVEKGFRAGGDCIGVEKSESDGGGGGVPSGPSSGRSPVTAAAVASTSSSSSSSPAAVSADGLSSRTGTRASGGGYTARSAAATAARQLTRANVPVTTGNSCRRKRADRSVRPRRWVCRCVWSRGGLGIQIPAAGGKTWPRRARRAAPAPRRCRRSCLPRCGPPSAPGEGEGEGGGRGREREQRCR